MDKEENRVLNVQLPPELKRRLRDYSQRHTLSMGAAIRLLLIRELERDEQPVTAAR